MPPTGYKTDQEKDSQLEKSLEELRKNVKEQMVKFVRGNTINTPINHLWQQFSSTIRQLQEKFVLSRMSSSRYSQTWFNRECKKHVRMKKRLNNKARRTGLDLDWFRFKDAAARLRKTCKKACNNFISSSVASNNKSDSKRFFSFIKSKRNENVGISPLRENNTMKIADKVKARILNHQFSSVFSIDDQKTPEIKSPRTSDMDDIIITTGGVKKLLDDLNVYKANGPDVIPARMLKETSNEITEAMTLLFKVSLTQSDIPDTWREILISPLFKGGGDRNKAENYRPISLTSISGKVLEHILHSNIMKHLENNNILTDLQHGFREHRSCETQLIKTVNDLAKSMNLGEQIDSILLDFSNAFDKACHRKLLVKLEHYGI